MRPTAEKNLAVAIGDRLELEFQQLGHIRHGRLAGCDQPRISFIITHAVTTLPSSTNSQAICYPSCGLAVFS